MGCSIPRHSAGLGYQGGGAGVAQSRCAAPGRWSATAVQTAVLVFLSCFTYAGTIDIGWRIYPTEAFLVVLALIRVAAADRVPTIGNRMLVLALAVLALIHYFAFAVALNANPEGTMRAVAEAIRIVLNMLVLVFVYRAVETKSIGFDRLVGSFIWTGVFVSAYGVYQAVSVFAFGEYISLIPGSSHVPNENGRAVGTFMEGGYAALFIGAALLLAVIQLRRHRMSRREFAAAGSVAAVGLLLTQSTIGIFSFLISVGLIVSGHPSLRRNGYIVAGVMFVAGSGLLVSEKAAEFLSGLAMLDPGNESTLLSVGHYSAYDRLVRISAALSMFMENPLTGVGLGQYSMLIDPSSLPGQLSANGKPISALSVYFEVLAELGVGGLGLFALALALAVYVDWPWRGVWYFVLMNFMAYPTYKFAFIWILVALLVLSRSWGKDANAALSRPAGEMPLLTGDSLSPH